MKIFDALEEAIDDICMMYGDHPCIEGKSRAIELFYMLKTKIVSFYNPIPNGEEIYRDYYDALDDVLGIEVKND